MKTFFMKALMTIMAVIAMAEGLILFMVVARRISPDNVASFYYFISETPKAQNAVAAMGAALLIFGIGLAIAALRIRGPEKPILWEKDGKVITIYRSTVRDFVDQVLGQDGAIDNFSTQIAQKGKHALEITISSIFNAVDSVPRELERIENTIKEKMSHVFGLSDVNVIFQVKGVRAAIEKKDEPQAELAVEDKAAATSLDNEVVAEEDAVEEDEIKEEKGFLQKMFSANLYKDRLRRKRQ